MQIKARTLKWAMRFYPPLFFQRIWVKKISPDFRSVEVFIYKSLINKNYNGSIFGGTIYAATDPFYALLFDQLMRRKGYKTRVWLKSAEIKYLKPGRKRLSFIIQISDKDLAEAVHALDSVGKFVKALPMEIYDSDGLHCASVMNEVYVRNLFKGEDETVAY